MTGSLQIKCNKYYVVLDMRDEFGKRKRKWINTQLTVDGNNKRKAEKMLRESITKYDDRKVVFTKDVLFSDYIVEWLGSCKNQIELSTYEGYENTINNHIVPFFKKLNVTLQSLEAIHIQKYYDKLLNRGLSPSTVKRHHANIRKCLQDALYKNMIAYNPADRVKLPKTVKYQASYYNKEQIGTLLEHSKGTAIETHIFLACYYGLRRSEIAGLKWSAIDFVNKTITIKDTVVCVKTKVDKSRTKTHSSHRTLPLIDVVEAHLKQLQKQQREYRLLLGREYTLNDYVCKREDGKPISPDYVSEAFKNLLEKHKLPHIRFHDLRHD